MSAPAEGPARDLARDLPRRPLTVSFDAAITHHGQPPIPLVNVAGDRFHELVTGRDPGRTSPRFLGQPWAEEAVPVDPEDVGHVLVELVRDDDRLPSEVADPHALRDDVERARPALRDDVESEERPEMIALTAALGQRDGGDVYDAVPSTHRRSKIRPTTSGWSRARISHSCPEGLPRDAPQEGGRRGSGAEAGGA